jgi:aryl-alcohol dehydrogenase-like predicted oxidoreductase
MEHVTLGRSGLRVSRLVLGTMNIGWTTDEVDGHALLDRALELGINLVDTANIYGARTAHPGYTEEVIGRWFAAGGDRRERTVLATKCFQAMVPFGEAEPWPNQRGLSAWNIRRSVEDSLRRLQTDHIDLLQMHHVDRATPWEEIWEAFTVLRQQGKVSYFGSSNFAGWHLASMQEAAIRHGLLGLISEQSVYSLLKRDIELEVLPAARHYGLGVLPWSPLAGGLLGGVLRKQKEGRAAGVMVARGLELHGEQIARYEALCDELGEHPADVGLAWLLAQPGVTGPVIGPRTVEQLDASLRVLDLQLEPDFLARLDEIFPGPGGPAPEAYAW